MESVTSRTRFRYTLDGAGPATSVVDTPASGDGRVIELVDTPGKLVAALRGWDPPVVGVDVERADSERYHRKAALVQIGDATRCLLVDAVRLTDFTALDDWLATRLAVLHAGQNDVVPLEADGIHTPRSADTSLAAQLLGRPAGLGPLLAELLGVELTPDKERFQRADWEARPIPGDMLDYAAGDVFDLPELWRILEAELHATGRWEWYEQELVELLDRARRDDRSWERVRAAGKLDDQQRAVLRAVWEAREAIASEHDIAPNRLLREEVVLGLAQEPAASPRELASRQQRRKSPVHQHAEAIFAAQQAGLEAEPEPRDRGNRTTQADRTAFDAMRKLRSARAKELGIDAGVLLSGRNLQPAAYGNPADRDELVALADLRPWQADLLGDALWEAWVAAHDDED